MKKLFSLILPIMFCVAFSSAIASDNDKTDGLKRESTTKEINIDNETDVDESVAGNTEDKRAFLKEQKKGKKKKGERNVKVQPSKEDDENIIMYLDKTED
ncbi:MAG: hypothetical protein HY094_04065 [Candidatus Melainabacteria bacterium]|nr:hypothetical protein [Candidatus Melainabacteria bacterium]